MIDPLRCFREADHPIRLYSELKLDLHWWHQFLTTWNGVRFWLFPGWSPIPDVEVTSDAAVAVGFRAYFECKWFNGIWDPSQGHESIANKEFLPIAIAAHVWSYKWSRKHVLFHSDNEAVLYILNSRTSEIPSIICLIRSLLMSMAHFHFLFSAQHIPGIHNEVTDALSRFN